MSFCRATRTYFNASEGVEATNQFGEKHLYSPFAEFHYCMDCGKRLVTEQIESKQLVNEILPIIYEDNTRQTAYKRIKIFQYIKERYGEIEQALRKSNTPYSITGICDEIYYDVVDKFQYRESVEEIKWLVRLNKEEFNKNIRNLKNDIKKDGYYTPLDERQDIHGDFLCNDCTDNYKKCEDCGVYRKKDEFVKLTNPEGGTFEVCEYCFDDHYVTCRDCSCAINTQGNRYEIVGDEYVCDACLSELYAYCEGCNTYHHNEYIYETSDGHYFCEDCYYDDDLVVECAECGDRVTRSNAEYDEDDGVFICGRCGGNGLNAIHNYSYKPRAKMHGRSKEKFGFEIEVDGNIRKARNFLEEFGDKEENDIYLKRDGSVDGFEIVTHPMTRAYFYREFVPKLEKGMSYLRRNGFKGHNRAGIHIHVSTEAIDEDMLKKMMILMYSKQEKTYKLWLKITQRKSDQMNQWSSMNPRSLLNGDKKYVAKLIDEHKESYNKKKPDLSYERYTAINCRNTNTIEFRIFNSNIRTERIIKNAQVIFSLIDFTKTDRLPTMSNYLKYIEKNSKVYPELYDFLVEKEIVQPKEQKEKIEELMNVLNVKSIEGLKASLTSIQNKQSQNVEASELNTEDDERNEQCA